MLASYSSHIFPGQICPEPRGSAIVDFVKPIIGDVERVTLDGVLEGLSQAKAREPVIWADMGGGRGLPMRQLGSKPDSKQKLQMINVDLFDFGLKDLKADELEYLEELAPGMTEPRAKPALITADIETVLLPEPADIITSVEAMQYLNNPLKAMVNWYNQLADNGIMIIATKHDWASWIRYSRDPSSSEQHETPAKHLLRELSLAGIRYAVTYESDWQNGVRPNVDPNQIRIMAIQKKPGTLLRVTKPATEVWINHHNFKAVYYELPTSETTPIVEVVSTHAALGSMTLESIS